MGEERLPPTPSQTIGPFFGFALPFAGDREPGGPGRGELVRLEGRLLDGAGQPVPDGLVEVWAGDQFARCATDPEGAFHLTVRKPEPTRTPAGRPQAPHLGVAVFARGLLRHLATRMYFPDEEEANAADPVLALVEPAARESLLARRSGAGLSWDVRLQGEGETVFFAL